MKSLLRLGWILFVQYISCRLANWDLSISIYLLSLTFLWQMIFIVFNYKIENGSEINNNNVSFLTYLLFSLPAMFSPVISILVFFSIPVLIMLQNSGLKAKFVSLKEKAVLYHDPFDSSDVDSPASELTNPATGLVMSGGTDVAGNSYGVSNHQ